MIKYDVKTFEEFFKCMTLCNPVYIERKVKNNPIPEIYGLIFPYASNDAISIALCMIDDNADMNYKDFIKMIINTNLTNETKVRVLTLENSLDIYETFSEHNLFVLDTLIEKDIEINN